LKNGNITILFAIKFIVLSILINLFSVPLHELGHAIIYTLQGYKVDFHLTQADPLSGDLTLLGSSGGIIFNLLIGGIFLILFLKYEKIYLYMVIIANTFFPRILLYILRFGRALKDESVIAAFLNVKPIFIVIVVVTSMLLLFVPATKKLFEIYDRKNAKFILLYTLISSVLSLFILITLESKGL